MSYSYTQSPSRAFTSSQQANSSQAPSTQTPQTPPEEFGIPAPLCEHGKPSKRLTSKTSANTGRVFYKCAERPDKMKCKLFKWEDELPGYMGPRGSLKSSPSNHARSTITTPSKPSFGSPFATSPSGYRLGGILASEPLNNVASSRKLGVSAFIDDMAVADDLSSDDDIQPLAPLLPLASMKPLGRNTTHARPTTSGARNQPIELDLDSSPQHGPSNRIPNVEIDRNKGGIPDKPASSFVTPSNKTTVSRPASGLVTPKMSNTSSFISSSTARPAPTIDPIIPATAVTPITNSPSSWNSARSRVLAGRQKSKDVTVPNHVDGLPNAKVSKQSEGINPAGPNLGEPIPPEIIPPWAENAFTSTDAATTTARVAGSSAIRLNSPFISNEVLSRTEIEPEDDFDGGFDWGTVDVDEVEASASIGGSPVTVRELRSQGLLPEVQPATGSTTNYPSEQGVVNGISRSNAGAVAQKLEQAAQRLDTRASDAAATSDAAKKRGRESEGGALESNKRLRSHPSNPFDDSADLAGDRQSVVNGNLNTPLANDSSSRQSQLDVAKETRIEDWKYLSEGAANAVFSFQGKSPTSPFYGKVLRIRKCPAVAAHSNPADTQAIERNSFWLENILPKLVDAEFLPQSTQLTVDPGWLMRLQAITRSDRPAHRVEGGIGELETRLGKMLVTLTDNLLVGQGHSALELKPKCGSLAPKRFLSASSRPIKKAACRFCLHRCFRRMGPDNQPEFCPIDLYSKELNRRFKAARSLTDSWMHTGGNGNNLRIFQDGEMISTPGHTDLLDMPATASSVLAKTPSLLAGSVKLQRALSMLASLQSRFDPIDIEWILDLARQHNLVNEGDGGLEFKPDLREEAKIGELKTLLSFPTSAPGNSAGSISHVSASPRDALRNVVVAYSVAAVFKDCSVLVSWPTIPVSDRRFIDVEYHDEVMKVTLVDLDLKPLAKLNKWFQQDQEIWQAARDNGWKVMCSAGGLPGTAGTAGAPAVTLPTVTKASSITSSFLSSVTATPRIRSPPLSPITPTPERRHSAPLNDTRDSDDETETEDESEMPAYSSLPPTSPPKPFHGLTDPLLQELQRRLDAKDAKIRSAEQACSMLRAKVKELENRNRELLKENVTRNGRTG